MFDLLLFSFSYFIVLSEVQPILGKAFRWQNHSGHLLRLMKSTNMHKIWLLNSVKALGKIGEIGQKTSFLNPLRSKNHLIILFYGLSSL